MGFLLLKKICNVINLQKNTSKKRTHGEIGYFKDLSFPLEILVPVFDITYWNLNKEGLL